jgi:hypothetical protein
MLTPTALTYTMGVLLCFAAIPTAFWDQLIHSEADSNNLFAVTTPHVDRNLQPSTPSFHSYARDTSQGMYLTVTDVYS